MYRVSRTLLEQTTFADDACLETVECLGEAALVELVALLGYSALVAMRLNAFGIGVPAGSRNELR